MCAFTGRKVRAKRYKVTFKFNMLPVRVSIDLLPRPRGPSDEYHPINTLKLETVNLLKVTLAS
jgi:hypothetical protein